MHYYNKDGDSCHEIVGKNGRQRPTTLADARKLQLYPSVTTIMDIAAKLGLVFWMQRQLLLAAMRVPYDNERDIDLYDPESWDEDDIADMEGWKKARSRDSKKIGDDAAKRGNEIHDLMEKSFLPPNVYQVTASDTDLVILAGARKVIDETFPRYHWLPEASFAHPDGFGGRVDLHGQSPDGDWVIIDFKTKDKSDEKDMVQYDDHRIQLAAYQSGLKLPENTRRFNLFISVHRDTPGLCKLVECTEFDRHKEIFYTLMRLWQLKNRYKPEAL